MNSGNCNGSGESGSRRKSRSICKGCLRTRNCINGLFCTKQNKYVEHKNGERQPSCYTRGKRQRGEREEGPTLPIHCIFHTYYSHI